jgi:probable HAF family extracellular repeat protein
MRRSHLSPTLSIRATLVFLGLVVSAMALVVLGTKPAESQQAPAQPLYEVHDLGTLGYTPEGYASSYANGINNSGQVVGTSSASGEAESHAFLYSEGQMSDLGTFGGCCSEGLAINDADKVVGRAFMSGDVEQHAFLYSGGSMRDLGVLGGSFTNSAASDINNSDQVVGTSFSDGDAEAHPFLYSGGQMSDLGTLGGSQAYATAINDGGNVVGISNLADNPNAGEAFLYSDGVMKNLNSLIPADSLWHLFSANDINDADKVVGSGGTRGEQHAFLYSDGHVKDLGTLEGFDDYSYGRAINNSDEVVGISGDIEGNERPFLYSDGVMRDLNSLIPADSGWEIVYPAEINDNGYIVGYGIKDGQTRAFLLTPVPYFDGFYQSVDNLPTLNKSKPGKTVPIRFSLEGNKGLDIFADGYPKSEPIPCDSTATVDGIEETVTGKGGLSYNASTDTTSTPGRPAAHQAAADSS